MGTDNIISKTWLTIYMLWETIVPCAGIQPPSNLITELPHSNLFSFFTLQVNTFTVVWETFVGDNLVVKLFVVLYFHGLAVHMKIFYS